MLSPMRGMPKKFHENQALYPKLENLLGVRSIRKDERKAHLVLANYLNNNTFFKYLPDMVDGKSFSFDVNTPISTKNEADIDKLSIT